MDCRNPLRKSASEQGKRKATKGARSAKKKKKNISRLRSLNCEKKAIVRNVGGERERRG